MAEAVSNGNAQNSGDQEDFPDGIALGAKIAHGKEQVKEGSGFVRQLKSSYPEAEKYKDIESKQCDGNHKP